MRQGLRSLLVQPGLEVVGEAENGWVAVELAKQLTPDVLVMDADLPELNGPEAARKIRESVPSVKILALTTHSEQRHIFEMLRAGAAGYLLKTCSLDELVNAIQVVHSGGACLSSDIAGRVMKGYAQGPLEADRPAPSILSNRERQVLQLVAEGKSSKDIGRILSMTENTVVTHRQHIMAKLNIRSIAALTRYAIREGLSPLEA
jgi:DNA-binding NarL/FixJ family response regulator